MLLADYLRYSSDMQRHESITAQHRAIEEWANKNGHKIIKTYADEALSGKTDNRTNFMHMIEDAKNKTTPWEGIVVHKLDRFARNRYDTAIYKKILKDNNKAFFSATENLDDSPESVIMESVLSGMAEYYSLNLAREVKKGQKENALVCKHNGGTPPLGYDVDENLNYVINEKEAVIVKLIFNRYSKGYSISDIVRELNANGYKTKTGKNFGKNSIYELVRNEKYIGTYTFGYGGRQRNRNVPSKDIIRIENGMPAIIDKEVFEMVKKRTHIKPGGSGKAKNIYLLTGVLFCGECNESYIGKSDGKYLKYICKGRANTLTCHNIILNKNKIENYILNNMYSIINLQISDEFLKNINLEYEDTKKDLNEEIRITKTQLTDVSKKVTNLINVLASGLDSKNVRIELNKLEDEKALLEDKLNLLNGVKSTPKISKEMIQEIIKKDVENIKELSAQEQKYIIHKYIKKILVFNDRIEITFSISNDILSAQNNYAYESKHSTGGDEGGRTPVQYYFHTNLSECSLFFNIPSTFRQ